MKIFSWNDIEQILERDYSDPFFKNGSGISIGSFDGVHKGHRLLLSTLTGYTARTHLCSGVVSFVRPLPSIKHSGDYHGDLTTLQQRLSIFESLGLDFAVIVDFTEQFASIRGIEFLQMLVDACNMKYIAEGIDFRCGYKGSTGVDSIRYFAERNSVAYDFVEPVFHSLSGGEDERVSSSCIRSMILKRFLTTAEQLLDRPYSLQLEVPDSGFVFEKSQITQAIPPCGVYRCRVNGIESRVEIFPECIEIQFDGKKGCGAENLKPGSVISVEF